MVKNITLMQKYITKELFILCENVDCYLKCIYYIALKVYKVYSEQQYCFIFNQFFWLFLSLSLSFGNSK